MATLFSPNPAQYLPHRHPFLMLDRVLEHNPGESAAGRYRTSCSTQYIPQSFLLEILAQLSGIAAAMMEGEGGFLAAVDHATFGRLPEPGDTFEVSARIVKSFGRLCMVQGAVTVGDEELLNATLTLGVGRL